MSAVREMIERLVASGVDPVDAAEIISSAVIHGASVAPKQRSAGAIRQERYRRNKASQGVTVTEGDAPSPPFSDKENPPAPPKEINSTPLTPHTSSLRSDVCPEPEKSAPSRPFSPTVIELESVSGEMVPISEAEVADWSEAFPAVNVRQQLASMRAWLNANPKNRKTAKGMRRFVVTWLSREQDRGGARQHSPPHEPRKTAHQLHQEACRRELEKVINGNRDYDERSDNIIDLAAADYRYR